MKVNELMIGDWVNFLIDVEGGDTEYDPVNEIYQPMQIVSLTAWGGNDGEVESAEGVINGFDQVKPIAITAEILEKNGFIKQWNGSWQFNDYHSAIISDDFYIAIFELSVRLDYVHELQHALRLAGVEKEIEP